MTPFDIANLGGDLDRLKEGRASEIVPPEDPDVRAYLVDAGLAAVIPAAWDTVGASHIDPPLARLARLHTPTVRHR